MSPRPLHREGFRATSLREITEPLGVTRAALHDHVQSKEDILLALHLRMHGLCGDALASGGGDLSSLGTWAAFLSGCIVAMLDIRRLPIMHERLSTAFETLHRKDHAGPGDPFENLAATLRSSPLSPRDRARVAASMVALMVGSTITILGSDASLAGAAEILLEVVRDTLRPAAEELSR
jgi:AcrR family transcriptional regulator